MASNSVTIAGVTFPDVPAVDLAKSGGGTARYTDVSDTTAAAADVATGKYFYTAAGVKTEGTNSGGGGSGVVVEETTDVGGGTIVEITAVNLSSDTVDAAHLVHGYTAHDSSGTAVTGTLYGTAIPQGMVLFNGYLLPQLPSDPGYDYYWIRANGSTGNFDLVMGTGQWYVTSSSGLNAMSLAFPNNTSVGAHQYSIPMDANEQSTSATDWGTYTVSYAATYGTGSNRKPIFTAQDIMIQGTSNICIRHGFAVLPTL